MTPLVAFLDGALDSVEVVQRAIAPRMHAVVGASVLRRARTGAMTTGRGVGRSRRLSSVANRVLTGEFAGRMTGVVDGVLGGQEGTRASAMTVRVGGREVPIDPDGVAAAFPSATGRVVVLLHGLIETERWWFHTPGRNRTGPDFGSRLAEDLRCTPVYVRYHSGRPVAANGRELTGLLDRLCASWPVPVTEIVLIGHSMGGLVARSAVVHAHRRRRPWCSALDRVVSLGTPFAGAPLERAAVRSAAFCARAPGLRALARVMALRSDGIKDLATAVQDDDWPPSVRELRCAGTVTRATDSTLARLVGDLVVAVSTPDTGGPGADHVLLGGVHHLDLLRHDSVYEAVRTWLHRTTR